MIVANVMALMARFSPSKMRLPTPHEASFTVPPGSAIRAGPRARSGNRRRGQLACGRLGEIASLPLNGPPLRSRPRARAGTAFSPQAAATADRGDIAPRSRHLAASPRGGRACSRRGTHTSCCGCRVCVRARHAGDDARPGSTPPSPPRTKRFGRNDPKRGLAPPARCFWRRGRSLEVVPYIGRSAKRRRTWRRPTRKYAR